MLLLLLLSFLLTKIQKNPALLRLICDELEECYSQLRKSKEGAALYSRMLITGESFWVCPCTGFVSTGFGLFHNPKPQIYIQDPKLLEEYWSLHLTASPRLLRILSMLNFSSSILLPRFLRGIGGLHRYAALIIQRIVCKIGSPELRHQSSMLCEMFSGMRLVFLNVPPYDMYCGHRNAHIAFQHNGLNGVVHTFLQANPGFPLTYQEICWLIYWAYEQQMRLLAHDAALFGLTPMPIEHLESFLNMDPNQILQFANKGGLLNRVLNCFKLHKLTACEAERVAERDRQIGCIIYRMVEGAMHSSDAARVPAPAPKKSEDNQADAVPYD